MPYVDLSDIRCYFEQAGSGNSLLMIPGLGGTCRLWDLVAPELAENFSLIMPDNRGAGRSVAKKPAKVLSDLAVDLVELLDALQLERASVLGISLGGVVAQRLAAEHPCRVDRLVLISTTHHFGPYLREIATLIGHALRHFPRELFERTIEVLGTAPQYLDAHPELIPNRLASCDKTNMPRSILARQLQCLACSEVNDSSFAIQAPTLVIAGANDVLIPSRYARELAQSIPRSRFVELPGCGHNPLLESPEQVVPLITQFLASSQLNCIGREARNVHLVN